jgi:molecular chaperone DnaK (HSP70)
MIHLGIDYGTANTRVSLYKEKEIPLPLAIGPASSQLMPSTCLVDSSGQILVGEQTLSRPERLRFVKRYWQDRPDDRGSNPWEDGKRTIKGKVFTCEMIAERVISEALTRAFAVIGPQANQEVFSANIVCPVTFDLTRRNALARILSDQGTQSVTLSSVIDEPLAAAVLYARVATTPPVNKDLLVFDSGAGTTDAAIVRYHEEGGWKRITVLAEQGRCLAGSDLDMALQRMIIRKIADLTGVGDRELIYSAYGSDPAVGRMNFEDECEQLKIALSNSALYRWEKPNFMGYPLLTFDITREEFQLAAHDVVLQIQAMIKGLVNEAKCFVEDFDGIDLALLVGGTSKVPVVSDIVTRTCGKPVVPRDEVYFDEMLATVRGIGFTKDFSDIIIKRPPYTIELRATLADGTVVPRVIHQAFDKIYDWWQTFGTAIPCKEVELHFEHPVKTLEVFFITPSGQRQAAELSPNLFRGSTRLRVRLNVRASLSLDSHTIQMPYFTQVGLKPPRPFDVKRLNAPDVYPDDN